MAEPPWLAMSYRDFHDIPRAVIVTDRRGRHFFFDCAFDESLDDYPPTYAVYELTQAQFDDAQRSAWTLLASRAHRIGTVDVSAVGFDPSKRICMHQSALHAVLMEAHLDD